MPLYSSPSFPFNNNTKDIINKINKELSTIGAPSTTIVVKKERYYYYYYYYYALYTYTTYYLLLLARLYNNSITPTPYPTKMSSTFIPSNIPTMSKDKDLSRYYYPKTKKKSN
ncbi:uncharacterized protein BKA78DRAFT_293560 [Phyllosticta capitalensis]|uniref:uncharacterized protein n=1 Tax=Phyllosticta capitalensis TaxID=121624 RepID=UPI00313261D6